MNLNNRNFNNIVLAHNFYGSKAPSGENQVFSLERNLLIANGFNVKQFTRTSDDLIKNKLFGLILGGISTPWSFHSYGDLSKFLLRENTHIFHAHNTFPLLSPSVFYAASKRCATVLTLHNYRIFCASGVPMRKGKICTTCIDSRCASPGLINRCYRDNFFATIPLTFSIALHRFLNTWQNKVDAFIALTDFQKKIMIDAGLPPEKVHVKPNFYPNEKPVIEWNDRLNQVIFVGRLSKEKGLETLIKAWRKFGESAPNLIVVGQGELYSRLLSMASGLPISFVGQLSSEQTEDMIARSKLLILPSECYEGFPMVIREAFALGTPVAVSNVGPLPEIVQNDYSGVVFEAFSSDSIVCNIARIATNDEKLKWLGNNAHSEFLKKYTSDVNVSKLEEIYSKAYSNFLNRRGG